MTIMALSKKNRAQSGEAENTTSIPGASKAGGSNRFSDHKSQNSDASAFDLWLEQGLHQLFDSVANEPIPEELLNLIEADRKQ